MKNLSIVKKIWFCVGVLLLGSTISMVLAFVFSTRLGTFIEEISSVRVPASRQSYTLKMAFKDQVTFYNYGMFLADPGQIKSAKEKGEEIQDLLESISLIKGIDKESLDAVKKAAAEHKAYTEEANQVFDALSKGDKSLKEKADALKAKSDALQGAFDSINQTNANLMQVRLHDFLRIGGYQRDINMGIFIVFVVLSMIVIALIIRRYISRPLEQIAVAVNDGAVSVSEASAQVASAGQSLSEGASNQASAIEETTSSLTEMAAMIKQNALNASETDKLMKRNTNEVLRQAKEAMERLSKSIDDISSASESTRRIIKTIDEIAFQTNLLALNAAVEAARAGEAGAGFAVVADEVRALAMRAAEAAKETTNLIDNTIQTVNQGKEFAVATQGAFGQNLELANKAATLVSEIAAASNEQASGIEQMNQAMASIDAVVQQIAAHAEETASASEELNAQSASMKHIVDELVQMLGMKRRDMDASQKIDETGFPREDQKTLLLK